MDSPEEDRSLARFLSEWREEIKTGIMLVNDTLKPPTLGTVFTGHNAPRRERVECANVSEGDSEDVYSPPKRQALSGSSKDPPLLLILPEGKTESGKVKLSEAVAPKVKEIKEKERLVDTLIADLVILCYKKLRAYTFEPMQR